MYDGLTIILLFIYFFKSHFIDNQPMCGFILHNPFNSAYVAADYIVNEMIWKK